MSRGRLGTAVYREPIDFHFFRLYVMRYVLLAVALYVSALVIVRGRTFVDPDFAPLYPAVPFTLFVLTLSFGRAKIHEQGFVPGVMGIHRWIRRGFQRGVVYLEVARVEVWLYEGQNSTLWITTHGGQRFLMGGRDRIPSRAQTVGDFVIAKCVAAGAAIEYRG